MKPIRHRAHHTNGFTRQRSMDGSIHSEAPKLQGQIQYLGGGKVEGWGGGVVRVIDRLRLCMCTSRFL